MPKRTEKIMHKTNHFTPVIALTANALTGVEEQYSSEGMDSYLAKPIETEKLANILKKWL